MEYLDIFMEQSWIEVTSIMKARLKQVWVLVQASLVLYWECVVKTNHGTIALMFHTFYKLI